MVGATLLALSAVGSCSALSLVLHVHDAPILMLLVLSAIVLRWLSLTILLKGHLFGLMA
ncbi:hypothetical protein Bca4012_059055 [Brassica carinata]